MEISHFMYISKTRKHDIFCTIPVLAEITHFMYNSKQGYINLMYPAHFQDQGHTIFTYYTFLVHILQHQKFYISCTFARQGHMAFPVHFCDIRNFMCHTHFQYQGHVTFTATFPNTGNVTYVCVSWGLAA